MKKVFKNRFTQEDANTIRKLKSTYIEMNYNPETPTTTDTPDGLFFISIQPNNFVDEVRLESDFKFILCLYYHWRYGSKWTSLKHLQFNFSGIIEKQLGNHNHLHLIVESMNIEELAMFLGYIKKMFKELYARCSFNFQRIYNLQGCEGYIDINNKKKLRMSSVIQLKSEYL